DGGRGEIQRAHALVPWLIATAICPIGISPVCLPGCYGVSISPNILCQRTQATCHRCEIRTPRDPRVQFVRATSIPRASALPRVGKVNRLAGPETTDTTLTHRDIRPISTHAPIAVYRPAVLTPGGHRKPGGKATHPGVLAMGADKPNSATRNIRRS